MSIWQQLQATLLEMGTSQVVDVVQNGLLQSVENLAEREGYPPDEMLIILLDQAIKNRSRMDDTHLSWDELSLREKQVAALVCQGLTGRQVAAKLVISPETVKTHVRHILRKFGISSRNELRSLLTGWDLSEWENNDHYPVIS